MKNFEGSSQAMEPETARRIWARSLDLGLVYSIFVGDGDSKAYQAVCNMNPYKFVKVSKQECTTHVTKRLGKTFKKDKKKHEKPFIYTGCPIIIVVCFYVVLL